ncbi:GAF domain-containing protein [Jeotgalibacillus soli]|uniref:GAF domain-containing protein n=1 Tax=Jeotgalibacillus soli TaxID=889306 RepID=A0A0C2VH83_9BACL|nr:GAF domain-containing protein [Jeotgalibacillus soli]KIL43866.1 hypothetical protein KP78_36900 [Jeotgalibacillus soli]
MFSVESYKGTKEEKYALLHKQLRALLDGETNQVANLSNASSLLNQFLDRVNWVGFYLNVEEELVLGPFQGLPACVRIPFGKGVCGAAVQRKETMLVENVHQFPGHIACDAASRSEIVVPIIKDDKIIGVLDIDSPELARFDRVDQEQLETFVHILTEFL